MISYLCDNIGNFVIIIQIIIWLIRLQHTAPEPSQCNNIQMSIMECL